ncbi:aminopeptidase N [Desulforhopalus vacuolatus]|uniref:aminopeptidase N n=1 Tax=Desulforhopalus vacuolatus TaxID=40414 RepID=UPI0019666B63|nr:aminopeptidase N [Desulforhopalus vacuolatus]MBM9520087.1 aminopeptidase N [Desulforhopalus vacuolatus]
MSEHDTIRLSDYKPFPFALDTIELEFQLYEEYTLVSARSTFRRTGESLDLQLVGEELELQGIELNGKQWHDFRIEDGLLILPNVPDEFTLVIRTLIKPAENRALEGLYKSSGNYCSQCEAEGFRKITWFPDRPDVLTCFTTRIEAERKLYPVLLSNGNLIDSGDVEEGRHFAVWQDPFPKPCYLFALVAGNLVPLEDSFTTCSGREVALKIYVEERNRDKCDHAMASLKRAMKWDEDVFGLEYDLDIFMIVAVDDFNMGAMENKGLNVFNSKYVLTSPDSATDQDYLGVEGVIGHEYFHNWTGDRVTLRDWFQLSLKEGLTVFRDQEFSSDMNSRPVQRIDDVRLLKNFQFKEDSGPLAHPVRPDNYLEINNFYTSTVYNKGAEVIRMIHTLIGAENFRCGMDLYIERHDGQAVTCEDFVAAMADASGVNLDQFFLWYKQSGTPVLTVLTEWRPEQGGYHLIIEQECPATPGQLQKQPFHIPITAGLVGRNGELELEGGVHEVVLELREDCQEFILKCHSDEEPVLSLLRNFSAPVRVKRFQSREQLARLASADGNLFNRWDSMTRLASEVILEVAEQLRGGGRTVSIDPVYMRAVRNSLTCTPDDCSLLSLSLQLPAETTLAQEMDSIDPDALHKARQLVQRHIARENQATLQRIFEVSRGDDNYLVTPQEVGRRSLKNVALRYLMALDPLPEEILDLCHRQFEEAGNMTDTVAALACLTNVAGEVRENAFGAFYEKWNQNPLVMDKWFVLQATSLLEDTLDRVRELMDNPAFLLTNPNKVRSLIGSFASANHVRFHAPDGGGYSFLADRILELNGINPQIAARLCSPLINWRRYEPGRTALMKAELERIASAKKLSRDVYEVVSKSLAS